MKGGWIYWWCEGIEVMMIIRPMAMRSMALICAIMTSTVWQRQAVYRHAVDWYMVCAIAWRCGCVLINSIINIDYSVLQRIDVITIAYGRDDVVHGAERQNIILRMKAACRKYIISRMVTPITGRNIRLVVQRWRVYATQRMPSTMLPLWRSTRWRGESVRRDVI